VEGDDYEQPRLQVKQFAVPTMKQLRDAVHFPAVPLDGGTAPAVG